MRLCRVFITAFLGIDAHCPLGELADLLAQELAENTYCSIAPLTTDLDGAHPMRVRRSAAGAYETEQVTSTAGRVDTCLHGRPNRPD
jgi:hypothetical protein